MPRWTHGISLMLVGCAAAGTMETGGMRTERVAIGSGGVRLTQDQVANAHLTVAIPAARVAQLLPDIYASLGFPVQAQNEVSIATGMFVPRGRIAEKRLSAHLMCGTSRGMENADTYEVTLQVQTRLIPAGTTSTTIESLVQATARPRGTAGSNPLTCSSNGTIEAAIVSALTAQVDPPRPAANATSAP
jgi:hypothetical protein